LGKKSKLRNVQDLNICIVVVTNANGVFTAVRKQLKNWMRTKIRMICWTVRKDGAKLISVKKTINGLVRISSSECAKGMFSRQLLLTSNFEEPQVMRLLQSQTVLKKAQSTLEKVLGKPFQHTMPILLFGSTTMGVPETCSFDQTIQSIFVQTKCFQDGDVVLHRKTLAVKRFAMVNFIGEPTTKLNYPLSKVVLLISIFEEPQVMRLL